MSARRLWSITRRIIDGFRRDHRTLALIFIVPVAVTALLGWVLRDQQIAPTRVAIVDLDVAAGGRLASAISDAAMWAGLTVVDDGIVDQVTARAALADDRIDAALVVPSGFVADLLAGGSPRLRLITQGANALAEGGHVAGLQRAVSRAILSLAPGGPRGEIGIERETVFGTPDADVLDVMAPVFIGYFAYFFVFILTGISFLRERVGGTLERLLATPVTKPEIVLGYSLGFGIFATFEVVILIVFSLMRLEVPAIGPLPAFVVGLDVPTAGSPLLAFLIALLLALGAVNLGIFLSTFARTELQILQFIPIVIVPQGLLAGIFWPVETLPDVLQPIARLLPLTYAVDGLRDVMIRGYDLGAGSVQLDIAVLATIAAFFVALAAGTIRREVA